MRSRAFLIAGMESAACRLVASAGQESTSARFGEESGRVEANVGIRGSAIVPAMRRASRPAVRAAAGREPSFRSEENERRGARNVLARVGMRSDGAGGLAASEVEGSGRGGELAGAVRASLAAAAPAASRRHRAERRRRRRRVYFAGDRFAEPATSGLERASGRSS